MGQPGAQLLVRAALGDIGLEESIGERPAQAEGSGFRPKGANVQVEGGSVRIEELGEVVRGGEWLMVVRSRGGETDGWLTVPKGGAGLARGLASRSAAG